LLAVAVVDRRFARARVGAMAGLVVCGVVLGAQASPWPGLRMNALTFAIVAPMPVLLVGYWLSGLFFVKPMASVERSLMAIDERLLRRHGIFAAYDASPRWLRESFEMAYVLVYPVIPAAVATLALGGHPGALPRFWTIVLLAEFISYGMMPWLQTRPPRVIEKTMGLIHPSSTLRRFNASILDRGSIQANTVPSGHAAGAVATALAVVDVMPYAGIAFLVVASAIVAATVLGRYHYLVDSLLGIGVAAGVWYFCR
jgi:membrane-associated phospholipid phosphatase